MALIAGELRSHLDGWFVDAINSLARVGEPPIDEVLLSIDDELDVEGTRAICTCHMVRPDGNGRPQVDALARYLTTRIVDYCIPRTRIEEAGERFASSGSPQGFLRLNDEARSLFVSIDTTGELGELLLFVLLEELLGAPQVLCKMSLKTNADVHFHGVDGIHVKAMGDGRLRLYWGEAKLYSSFSAALSNCFKSLAPYLLDDGSGPSQRDLLLARTHLDTGDEALTEKLVSYFVEGSANVQSREICGAALIGFGSNVYGLVGEDGSVDTDAVKVELAKWIERIAKSVAGQGIESFRLSTFCLPVPDAQALRDAFVSMLSRGG